MTLPASGVISTADLEAEFGVFDSNPSSINEYYRGGTQVHDITPNDSIPTSGVISGSDFYGTGNDDLNLTSGRIFGDNAIGTGQQDCTAGCRFEPNGDLYRVLTTISDQLITTDWLGTNRTGAGADYEINVTLISGTLASGSDSTGVWLSLSVSRTWLVNAHATFGVATSDAIIEVSIRDRSSVFRVGAFGSPPDYTDAWHLSARAERTD